MKIEHKTIWWDGVRHIATVHNGTEIRGLKRRVRPTKPWAPRWRIIKRPSPDLRDAVLSAAPIRTRYVGESQ